MGAMRRGGEMGWRPDMLNAILCVPMQRSIHHHTHHTSSKPHFRLPTGTRLHQIPQTHHLNSQREQRDQHRSDVLFIR